MPPHPPPPPPPPPPIRDVIHDCNHTAFNATTILDYSLADIPHLVAGTVVFVVVLPLVLFHFRTFPMGTTFAVLTGAMLMVLTGVIAQGEVYEIIGHKNNLTTIFLLLGMMLISQYFEREQLLQKLLCKILKPNQRFEFYIGWICILSFILSAIFTNDACCAILTPLILKFWQAQKRPAGELETLLLAIATSANIGSVTTISGNPQMALIATKTELPHYHESQLDLRRSMMFLGLPAILALLINVGFLIIHYHVKTRRNLSKTGESYSALSDMPTTDLVPHNEPESIVLVVEDNGERSKNFAPADLVPHKEPESAVLVVEDHGEHGERSKNFASTGSALFQGIIIAVLLGVVSLLLISAPDRHFDLGLVPIGGAVLITVVDAILNKRNAFAIIQRVDWSILLMFFGIFVWMDGLNRTRIPRWIWSHLGLAGTRMDTVQSIVVLCLFVVVGSNVFSNVPLTLIVLEQLEPCHRQLALVLYLAWCSTIAGNMTLFGSVANLIVLQKGYQTLGYRLSFFAYFKYGFLTTLFVLILGIVLIFALLQTGMT